ncbi:MAG: GDSL-type esterase/lipase family protein [Chloroflexota bacterium]
MQAARDRVRDADGEIPVPWVALGDSYTIGTSVEFRWRWPNQLADRLRTRGIDLSPVVNMGVDGFTSSDVVRDELPRLDQISFGFASLLIGVNDVIRGITADRYAANLAIILDALLARLPAARLLTVSTPDYTVTPAGRAYGEPVARAAGIRTLNAVLAAASGARNIAHVDIHDLSLLAAHDRSLVAEDGLHPSGAQYALWVDRIEPVVARLLGA